MGRYASIWVMTDGQQPQGLTFGAFVMSLATTAAVHFGDLADPVSGTTQANITAAGQMIDILAMLQAKTKGNLDADEEQLVDQILYELRMRYLEASKQDRRIIIP